MVVQVIAIDEEESTFRSNATVNITIKDINDNSPTFPKDSYKLSVPEHAPNGTVISNFTVSPVLTSLLETIFWYIGYIVLSFPGRGPGYNGSRQNYL